VAKLIGVGTDSERAIRSLFALMVLCCDPLTIGFDRGVGSAVTTPKSSLH
jgi:hypothetical protein